MKIYLAGPDVFHPQALALGLAKKSLVARAGHQALYPLDSDHEADAAHQPLPQAAKAIFQSNRRMIEAADAVLANLTPFRSPSADAGTVWEAGFAAGLGKPVYGYSNVATSFAARTRAFLETRADGMDVEDFGLQSDNLMIHHGLAGFFAHEAPADALWTDLTSFAAALGACIERDARWAAQGRA
jgi:nucleoside 2-deoxyribosyltransferase